MIKIKTYLIQSKMTYTLIYGAWLDGNNWCWLDRDGSTVYMTKEFYKVLDEW
jgi:hypothetical protein